MLKLGRFTKVKVLFLVLVFVFNFDLFKFSAAILEKGLLTNVSHWPSTVYKYSNNDVKAKTVSVSEPTV